MCNRLFWAGLPTVGFQTVKDLWGGKSLWFGFTSKPEWVEHCSRACADEELILTFGPDPERNTP
jgi:hypothetical protein